MYIKYNDNEESLICLMLRTIKELITICKNKWAIFEKSEEMSNFYTQK